MKPAVALLASACLALAGSVAVRAELLQPGNSRAQVNDAAVLQGLPQNLSDFGFFENQTEQQPGQGVRRTGSIHPCIRTAPKNCVSFICPVARR